MKILRRIFLGVLGELFLELRIHQRHFLLADQVGGAGGEDIHQKHIADHSQRRQEAGGDPSEPAAAENHDGAQADEMQGQADVDATLGGVLVGE